MADDAAVQSAMQDLQARDQATRLLTNGTAKAIKWVVGVGAGVGVLMGPWFGVITLVVAAIMSMTMVARGAVGRGIKYGVVSAAICTVSAVVSFLLLMMVMAFFSSL